MTKESNNLSTALARAQATMNSAQKSGHNPHFRSTFSTLEDLILASRESLTREGLSVTQFLDAEGDNDYLVTQLRHASGEIINSKTRLHLKDKTDIQKLGSAISYLKRYSYAAICGIATSDNDDDGNSVSHEVAPMPMSQPTGKATEKQIAFIKQLLKGNIEREAEYCIQYDVDSLAKLSFQDASTLISTLKV